MTQERTHCCFMRTRPNLPWLQDSCTRYSMKYSLSYVPWQSPACKNSFPMQGYHSQFMSHPTTPSFVSLQCKERTSGVYAAAPSPPSVSSFSLRSFSAFKAAWRFFSCRSQSVLLSVTRTFLHTSGSMRSSSSLNSESSSARRGMAIRFQNRFS